LMDQPIACRWDGNKPTGAYLAGARMADQ
jgi:hypothetical protein